MKTTIGDWWQRHVVGRWRRVRDARDRRRRAFETALRQHQGSAAPHERRLGLVAMIMSPTLVGFRGAIEFACAFCGRRVKAGTDGKPSTEGPPGDRLVVLHEERACATFLRLAPVEYLEACSAQGHRAGPVSWCFHKGRDAAR